MKKRLVIAPLLILLVVGILTTFAKSADVPRMTKDELRAMLNNPALVILDVRSEIDWKDSDSKIKGAIREDPESVKSWAGKYSKEKEKTFVLYCA
jgi:rhodanese-related sulfurtransferase